MPKVVPFPSRKKLQFWLVDSRVQSWQTAYTAEEAMEKHLSGIEVDDETHLVTDDVFAMKVPEGDGVA